jgi:hypothetical protein
MKQDALSDTNNKKTLRTKQKINKQVLSAPMQGAENEYSGVNPVKEVSVSTKALLVSLKPDPQLEHKVKDTTALSQHYNSRTSCCLSILVYVINV